jgi:hypothetical protein
MNTLAETMKTKNRNSSTDLQTALMEESETNFGMSSTK